MPGADESYIPYRYQPLRGKPGLRFLKPPTVQDDEIHFERVGMSLDDVALSTFIASFYTWGETERPERIYNVDISANSSLNVTGNLLVALQHRRRRKNCGNGFFWIDVICFN
jgi:hypothetical protein